jgi:CRISPR-associated protein Cas1
LLLDFYLLTTPALWELAEHGIEIAFFTQSGKLLCQLTSPWPKNLPLREAQWRRRFEPEFVLRFSKSIVIGKLNNALAVIHDFRSNHPELDCATELSAIETARTKAESAAGLDSLLGLEGSATAAYFKVLGRMFMPPWQFTTRTRRPPKDPVNAVLSFGYVVVGNELQALLDGFGFDPYLGFYHAVEYGRPGLALDLLEEFRHPLVDRLALNLFNLGSLTGADFAHESNGGVYLNTAGKKKFFLQYERMLGELAGATDPAGKPRGFRAIFQNQVAALMKAMQHNIDYAPFQMQ